MAWYSSVKPTSPIASTYLGLNPDLDQWSCADFVTYWKRLKASGIGLQAAKDIFLNDIGNTGAWASVNLCKYDCSFVNYFKSEGFTDIGNIFSNALCAANTVIVATGNVANAAANTAQAVANTTSTVSKLTQPKYLIAIAILGGLGYYEFKIKPNQKKTLKGYKRR
jgi:hypothetical protein